MPSIRLTLVNNAKQTQRAPVLLKAADSAPFENILQEIFTLAKNKLRLKKAKTIYLASGLELTDLKQFSNVAQDSLLFISCGETFVGGSRSDISSSVSATTVAALDSNENGKDTQQENKSQTLPSTETTTSTPSSLTPSEPQTEQDRLAQSLKSLQLTTVDEDHEHISALITVLAKKSFVDPDAISQLNRTAMLPGMKMVVGQPDLHPGNQHPIGAAFLSSKSVFYPALIGNDIGCGMALYKTKLSSTIKPQKIVDRLHHLEGRWTEGSPEEFLFDRLPPSFIDSCRTAFATNPANLMLDQLGTLGGGNHFAEFTIVEEIVDSALAQQYDIDASKVHLIVHSGSRKVGQQVLDQFSESTKGMKGLRADTPRGQDYIQQHDLACEWARINRELIAHRVLHRLNAEEDAVKILDIWHNNLELKSVNLPTSLTASSIASESVWIHRKGAAPSDRGLVVIPGSRGHFSFLVLPHGSQDRNAFSLAHGAGRLLPRAKALQKRSQASKTGSIQALQTTSLGSSVICEDTDLLFEEQPAAYKEISEVIEDLQPFVKVVAILRPICTYKMRKENRT